jgi:hypothetical protein
MECDNMHAAVERAQKHLSLYLMHDWENVMKYVDVTSCLKSNSLTSHISTIWKKLSGVYITNHKFENRWCMAQLAYNTATEPAGGKCVED